MVRGFVAGSCDCRWYFCSPLAMKHWFFGLLLCYRGMDIGCNISGHVDLVWYTLEDDAVCCTHTLVGAAGKDRILSTRFNCVAISRSVFCIRSPTAKVGSVVDGGCARKSTIFVTTYIRYSLSLPQGMRLHVWRRSLCHIYVWCEHVENVSPRICNGLLLGLHTNLLLLFTPICYLLLN